MSDIDSNLPTRDTSDGIPGIAAPAIANQIAGSDGTNLRTVKTDTNGKVQVDLNDGSGIGITSSAVSTKQGLDVNVLNSFAAGIADKSTFTYGTSIENSVGGVFQDTSPTLTAGQQGAVRLTANRAFHSNLRDASGNELLGQKTMVASVPVTIASDQTAVPASQSGTWNINNVTGTVSLPTGAATSANQTNGTQQAQIVQGGNTATVTASSALKVDGSATTQPISGTVTANQGGTWSVTANAGTNLNTSALALDTSVNGIIVSQGSTTSGEKGPLIQGAVTTAAPTYTTAQTSPLSLTTAGALRVDSSGSTQPISGTVTANQGTNPWTVQGTSASGASKAGNPVQIGGVFNTTQPTVTTGQTVESQMTARGAQIVSTGVDNFNVNNISGTISLPTGAATAANQTTEITSLQIMDNPVGSVGAGTAGTSSYLTGGVFNTALPTLTTGQQVATQLDSSGRIIVAPLTNASVIKAQLQDNTGNALASNNSQLQVRDVINTAGQYRAQSVTTSAAEALGAATILANRKFLSITPTNNTIYWGFSNTVTTLTGTPIFKNQTMTISATDNVHIYVIAGSTTDCRIAEGS